MQALLVEKEDAMAKRKDKELPRPTDAELEILRVGQEVALPRVQAAIVEIHGRTLIEPIDEIMRACGLEQVYPSRNLLHFYLRRPTGL